MAQEIERKFLVAGDHTPFVRDSVRIVQGYLSSVPERSVRVRIKADQGYLTVKGKSNTTGVSRFEWETAIDTDEAESLLKICEPGVIDKVRNIVEVGSHTYEVDVFHGDNEGLVVAEVELSSEDEVFARPDWLGAEVTGVRKYYNSMLTKTPYTKW